MYFYGQPAVMTHRLDSNSLSVMCKRDLKRDPKRDLELDLKRVPKHDLPSVIFPSLMLKN